MIDKIVEEDPESTSSEIENEDTDLILAFFGSF